MEYVVYYLNKAILLLYNQINFELSNSLFSRLKDFNLLLSITYIKGIEQINPPIKLINKKKFIIDLYLV